MQRVSILGSTGSIGTSTLDVLRRHPRRYRVQALCAHRQADKLLAQCLEFEPEVAVLNEPRAADDLQKKLRERGAGTEVLAGTQALIEVAGNPGADIVMAAIVGAAGLEPALAAARTGKKLLLANKEALVMAGELFMNTVRAAGTTLLPVDSEHNAIFQALPEGFADELESKRERHGLRRVILTASGGPFLRTSSEALRRVTPKDACAHPNWSMGQKISVDSATMMNKGLEVIEACWLFGLDWRQVEVLVHPQSIVHSLVEYTDGSVLAQMGNPDMRTPIAHGLAYPERAESGVPSLDLSGSLLEFSSPDRKRFPCLKLAYDALRLGGAAPTVLNAVNEVAVGAFLAYRIGFLDISAVIAECVERLTPGSGSCGKIETLDEIVAVDTEARRMADDRIALIDRP